MRKYSVEGKALKMKMRKFAEVPADYRTVEIFVEDTR